MLAEFPSGRLNGWLFHHQFCASLYKLKRTENHLFYRIHVQYPSVKSTSNEPKSESSTDLKTRAQSTQVSRVHARQFPNHRSWEKNRDSKKNR